MTDVLTRLAAITENDPDGTTPRPWSVGAQNPMTGEVNVHHEYRDPSFTTTGGRGIRVVATLGNRFRRKLDDEARANAELIVATMNREATLIALVQEAAREIERLNKKILKLEWVIGVKDRQIMAFADELPDADTIAEKALSPAMIACLKRFVSNAEMPTATFADLDRQIEADFRTEAEARALLSNLNVKQTCSSRSEET